MIFIARAIWFRTLGVTGLTMLRVRLWFKMILYLSLGFLAALHLAGCVLFPLDEEQPQEFSSDTDTQVYQVSGAQVCDYERFTTSIYDDCDYADLSPGYYYNPGSQIVFYRRYGGGMVEVERNLSPPRQGMQPGVAMPMSQSVVTDAGGQPLTDNRGGVVRIPGSNPNVRSPNVTPVRSSASFDHPTLGRVTSGRTASGGRGVTFGGRSGGRSVS
jgi:hypothetical protein